MQVYTHNSWSRGYVAVRRAFFEVYLHNQGKLLDQILTELEDSEADSYEVMQFVKFIRMSKCGIIMRGCGGSFEYS